MDHPVDRILRLGTGKVFGPAESVTARNPMPGHSFAQHNGIEEIAWSLNAHDSSSVLIEVLEQKPDLKALGSQIEG